MKGRSYRKTGPTQHDIAKALRVSQATVAIALDPKRLHQLNPKTVARVLAKAKELNYHPQHFARILRRGRSRTIAVVFEPSVYHAPQEHVKALAVATAKEGYQLVAVDLGWFLEDAEAAQRHFLAQSADGIVVCNLNAELAKIWGDFLSQRDIPFISINAECDSALAAIDVDLAGATYALTQHLLEQGLERLELLLGFRDPDFTGKIGHTNTARIEGFVRAVTEAGGRIVADDFVAKRIAMPKSRKGKKEGVVGEIHYPIKQSFHQNVYDVGRYRIEEHVRNGTLPDGIVAVNDDAAHGAIGACHEYGIAIPEQLRITGFDNAPYSAYSAPPLTTVIQPSDAVAEAAVKAIIDRIEGREMVEPLPKIVFPCQVVVRKSSDPSLTRFQQRVIAPALFDGKLTP